MSEPFVISDTSSEPVQDTHDSYTEHNVDDTSSARQESYKTIQEISPTRMNLYMQQFTTSTTAKSNAKYTQKTNKRNGFKKKRFKKKRIKTLSLSNNLEGASTSTSNNRNSNGNDLKYNYYNDDPGLRDSDFNMQWQGISRIGLNTKME